MIVFPASKLARAGVPFLPGHTYSQKSALAAMTTTIRLLKIIGLFCKRAYKRDNILQKLAAMTVSTENAMGWLQLGGSLKL